MEQDVVFPTWEDVGIPSTIVQHIKDMPPNSMLSYLVTNRVFRVQIKSQYEYRCHHCDYRKRTTKIFEEYAKCEHCGHKRLSALPSYIMGKDQSKKIDENIIPSVLQQMNENYANYFQAYPPQDFFSGGWLLEKRHLNIAKRKSALGANADHDDDEAAAVDPVAAIFNPRPSVYAKFSPGEMVEGISQSVTICKAAILCPFLWDDCYDWKFNMPRDKGRETPILPLLHMWSRLRGERLRFSGDQNG